MTQLALALFVDDRASRFVSCTEKYQGRLIIHYASTCEHAKQMIEIGNYEFIFLDHDLGECEMLDHTDPEQRKMTIWPLVDWIVENSQSFKEVEFIVHSLNPEGRKQVVRTLESKDLVAHDRPFIWT